MKFKVGDKVRAEVKGEDLVGVIKEIDNKGIYKQYLCYFDSWIGGHNGNGACKGKYEGFHCWWLEDDELELIEREEKNMKKSDLKSGAIVETRNGNKYILLLKTKYYGEIEDLLVNLAEGTYMSYSNYDDDLTVPFQPDDIMKVCQHEYAGDNIRRHILKQDEDDWTWIREEETVMTISEIEEKLGISNLKIKKED